MKLHFNVSAYFPYLHYFKPRQALSNKIMSDIFAIAIAAFNALISSSLLQDSMSVVPTIADILLGQFQGESAVRWQGAYGAFCSQHSDSVTIYKDLYKSDRRKWPSYIFLPPPILIIIVVTAHRQNVLDYITTSVSDPDPH
jgi:hypothetical protein